MSLSFIPNSSNNMTQHDNGQQDNSQPGE